VLGLIALGNTNSNIAEQLVITPNTVANHVKRILSKTGTSNRTEAAAYAIAAGIAASSGPSS
jgi:DNA-binding NarL/FixJ family response regulator